MKFSVTKTDKDYNTIENYNRVLDAPTRRWAMKHLAYENGIAISDHQASLCSLTLKDETILFIEKL